MEKKAKKIVNLPVKAGDTVKVIAGDDRNKTGIITSVDREKQRVVIEGVNMKTKHEKPSAKNPQGGITKKEASVHVSNVALVDNTGKTFRTGRKMDANNKLQRYNKKTGNLI
jgi:large subunit ribosomal protein L24